MSLKAVMVSAGETTHTNKVGGEVSVVSGSGVSSSSGAITIRSANAISAGVSGSTGGSDASGIGLHSVWFAHEAQAHNALDPGVPHHAGNE